MTLRRFSPAIVDIAATALDSLRFSGGLCLSENR
jgi:hypothetical protein